ncbi:response regulator transcription factor [Pontiella agarivorans]|uniref:Response regulator transcription factor n=1 Tax=Pontiella agarivorans TaxID=3038953 RepID=A0ABU5MTK5_9BACT|nr:response regulator transcription factor [Pontiella agarivorans]MDZ8117554.1 response regulator transcription factor [Pontiella agarivorans]
MSEPQISVLIVDDNAMMRIGLSQTMTVEPGVTPVGAASNGAEAFDMYLALRPDLVIMDYQMPYESGVDCSRRILKEDPEAKIIFFSVFESEEDIWNAVQAGVRGYLTKKASEVDELMEAIHEVARGGTYFPAGMLRKIERRKEKPELTPRERDVLKQLAEGRSNQEIVDALNISLPTVKMHIVHIREKLGAQDRTQAVVIACKQGLLRLEE